MGDDVSGVNKARIGTNKSAVTSVIGHYNIEYLCSSKDELKQDLIMGRIQDASGSKNRVQEPAQSVVSPRSQPTGGKFSFVPANASADSGNFRDEAELKAIQKRVRADNDSLDWMLLGYVTKTQYVINILDSKSPKFLRLLTPDFRFQKGWLGWQRHRWSR